MHLNKTNKSKARPSGPYNCNQEQAKMTSHCRRCVEDRSGALGEVFRLQIPVSAWLLASVIGILVPAPLAHAAEAEACKASANWIDVKTGNALQERELLRDV